MADTSTKRTSKDRSSLAESTTIAAQNMTLADRPILYLAVEGFIRGSSNIESTIRIDSAIADLGKCEDLQAVFATPLQHGLLSMDSALRWVLFLSTAPDRATQEGDTPFSTPVFSPRIALALIAAVYDIGVQEAVWDHFELEDEDDDEDGDDEVEAGEDEGQ